MIETLKQIDREIFLALNGANSEFMDIVMWWTSDRFIWIPFYALLLFLVYRKSNLKTTLVVMVTIALVITLCDQLSVKAFKEVFQRYRPCHNLEIKEMVHLVHDKCGAKFGFVSSHAANVFGLATFLSFFFREKKYVILLIFWAAFVSYSRIYLGVHYPSDIIVGGILGALIGWGCYELMQRLIIRKFLQHD